MNLPEWLIAGLWGWFAGSSLLLGAAIGYFANLRQSVASSVMAFGSGVLISALCFELMDEAYKKGGSLYSGIGFLFGALLYTFATIRINRKGAKHRKRSSTLQISESEKSGSGRAIAIGTLIDGIPESVVIGLSVLSGKGASIVTVIAIFLSNVPEALSSSHGMKKSLRSGRYIFGVWTFITFISGISSIAGYLLFGNFPEVVVGVTIAVAGGGILTMLVITMIPEAVEGDREWAGPITVLGFLISFIISKMH